MLFRIQDRDGRGPFKPGFSSKWRDASGLDLPPFYAEIGILPHEIPDLIPKGMFAGCACVSTEQIRRWFSRAEIRRLRRYGYEIIQFEPDVILVETPTQVLFGSRSPLRDLARQKEAA